jgi:glycerol dehydrogenase
VQGRGATAVLGEQLVRLGLTGPALIVAGRTARRVLADQWRASGAEAGIRVEVREFGGECSRAEIARIRDAARADGCATLVGAGGGKTLDAARAAADDLELPFVSCPTVASSDAPCSAVSVIYSEDGEVDGYQMTRRNPALVLVDTAVVAAAPPRLLVAGMGDALATWYEARTCVAGHVRNIRGGDSTRSAAALAELCHRTLLADGAAALTAVREQAVTPALERVVEANTLLSGLGFESSGLAAAHAVHNGLTTLPPARAHLHGEKVAFGVITQLVLEGVPDAELATALGFCTMVGLPVTLGQLGLDGVDRADLERVAARATAEGETMHNEPFPVDAAMVLDALLAADALGREALAAAG